MSNIPAISGKELISLLLKNKWQRFDQKNHGVALMKKFPHNKIRVTTIKNQSDSLPKGTLMAILSDKQTGLGRKGLLALLKK